MSKEIPKESNKAHGLFFILFFGFLNLALCLFVTFYVIPRVEGVLLFFILNAAFLFGCGAIFLLAYCAPARSIKYYRLSDGGYLILRSRLINVVLSIILIYAAIILPVIVLLVVFFPLMLIADPSAARHFLNHFSFSSVSEALHSVYELLHVMAEAPVVIPLLIAFPWLYPKFLRAARRVLAMTFSDTGIKLDAEGLSVLGADARSIPWSWITAVDVAVHGDTDVLVFKGRPELMQLRGKLDHRLPKEIHEAFEWKGEGVPMKVEFLRVKIVELAEVIRIEFLHCGK